MRALQLVTTDYHVSMSLSLQDKLWFLGALPHSGPVAFADFGCADGSLLGAIGQLRPDAELLGYDLDADAITAASAIHPDAYWTPHLAFFAARIARLKAKGTTVVLILSSVVHEVISQGTTFTAMWNTIRSFGADFIAIRDMAVEAEAYSAPVPDALELSLMRSDKLTHWLLYGVKECGRLAHRAEMLHGLLKYQYDNVEKEYAENYFALTSEQWHNLATVASGYKLRHFEHYSMPYHRERWRKDFGVDIPDQTHIKILLKRLA